MRWEGVPHPASSRDLCKLAGNSLAFFSCSGPPPLLHLPNLNSLPSSKLSVKRSVKGIGRIRP